MKYGFGEIRLDTERRELTRGDTVVHLEPQVFDLLCVLIENRDRVVTKDDLIEKVWNGRIVSESSLSGRISDLRVAIGDDGRSQSMIRTIHSRGFQFVAPVSELGDSDELSSVGETSSAHAIAVMPLSTLSADIEQQVADEVGFQLVLLDKVLITAEIDAPIDVLGIIAAHICAELIDRDHTDIATL